MKTFQAVYYRAQDGSEPVGEFIAGLDVKSRAALLRQIDRLNDLSDALPHLPFPHSSQIEGELRELRCHMGAKHYRELYRRSKRLMVLLRVFPKKTGKLPKAEIEIAKRRWDDLRREWRLGLASRPAPLAAMHHELPADC